MLEYTYGVASPVQPMTTCYDVYKQILLRKHVEHWSLQYRRNSTEIDVYHQVPTQQHSYITTRSHHDGDRMVV